MSTKRPVVRIPFSLCVASLGACGGGGGGGAAPIVPDPPGWRPQSAPTGGANGRALVVADVDRDGLPDVVVANETFASVSFLAGRADGTLANGVLVPAPLLVTTIGVADVTGDRKADLVAASGATNALTVSAGNGDGTFAAAVPIALPWAARKLEIADWTGDGMADLVVSSGQTAEVALLPGIGGAMFGAPRIATLAFAASDFAIVDCNGDMRPDLVCTCAGAMRIDVLRNDGAGGFLPPVTTAADAQGGRFVCCDLDGDRVPEFVGVDAALTTVRVHRGDGAAGFGTAAVVFTSPHRIDGVSLGDVDGDGRADLVVAAAGQLFTSPGGGDRSFAAGEAIHADAVGAAWVVACDLRGDGRIDIAYVSGSDRVTALESLKPSATGLFAFGTGTPDCRGRIGMWANGSPRAGSTTFGYTTTNAPRDAVGVLLQGGPADVPGSDPLHIGVLLHVASGLLTTDLVFSDHLGACFAPRPIPAVAGLVGLPVHVQTVWQGTIGITCTSSPGGLSSSTGLTSTVQP